MRGAEERDPGEEKGGARGLALTEVEGGPDVATEDHERGQRYPRRSPDGGGAVVDEGEGQSKLARDQVHEGDEKVDPRGSQSTLWHCSFPTFETLSARRAGRCVRTENQARENLSPPALGASKAEIGGILGRGEVPIGPTVR